MTPIIRVRGLSKQYRIGARRARYGSLRDSFVSALTSPIGALRRRRAEHPTIWALKDVSFDVMPGEVVGIIGRNGAGKSTLLKILTRITEPTEGEADLFGRAASLLEVGTGFHPELTGRENIYLNGAILGMHRAEIARKFDEIVAFAEIDQFIDTAVKHYSSGMYVRLAFAVAAHLEPEILLVDEVLAVGDAAFQKRCLTKMEECSSGGRTVLFVSHNMATINRLCQRTFLLQRGRIIADGPTAQVTRSYMTLGALSNAERTWPDDGSAPGNETARLLAVRVREAGGALIESVDIREPFFIEVLYRDCQSALRPTAIVHLVNEDGITLLASNDWNNREWWTRPRRPGHVLARCKIPGNFLAEGTISVLVAIGTYNPNVIHALERDVVSFQVVDRSEGDAVRGEYAGAHWPGVVRPMLGWDVGYCDPP